ncbi:MAG TPA: DUF2279 domain-containing protein [Flavisolibacter sp.]|nr:DUF2279 domain-containing protein [Flavisolibacter sp.]
MKKWIFHTIIFAFTGSAAQDSLGASEHILPEASKPAGLHYSYPSPNRWAGRKTTKTPVDTATGKKGREWLVGGLSVLGYGGSFVVLNEAWYKGYPRSSFHVYNDAAEWQQVDKAGHAWSAYVSASLTTKAWEWAGLSKSKAVLLGSGTSLLYLLSIEYLDGRSAEWGWSWADVGADLFGTGLFAAQEKGWKEQRITLKFSSHFRNYEGRLRQRADELYGSSLPERLLKDYNAQSYWLSFNLSSLTKISSLPPWLNLSIGYGADGMYGGYDNFLKDENGNIVFDARNIRRYRQWYLSPDIDLTRIKTGSKLLRTAFFVLNHIKVPAPAVELSKGRLRLKAIAF